MANHAAGATQGATDAAAEQAGQVSSVAADRARQVTGNSLEQARLVRDEAVGQAASLVDQAKGELRCQAESQAGRIADGLRQMSEQGRALMEGRRDEAGPLAGYADQLFEKVDQMSEHIRSKGALGLVDDLRGFARRRPGLFLASAGGIGIVLGRLTRAGGADAALGGTADGDSSMSSFTRSAASIATRSASAPLTRRARDEPGVDGEKSRGGDGGTVRRFRDEEFGQQAGIPTERIPIDGRRR